VFEQKTFADGITIDNSTQGASSSLILLNGPLTPATNVLDIPLSHFGVNWEGDDALKSCASIREILRFITELVAVIRMKMDRNEMKRRFDVLRDNPLKKRNRC
jgi:hypothetical protein